MPDTHLYAFEIVERRADVEIECQLRRYASWQCSICTSSCVKIDNIAYPFTVPIDYPVVAIERWLIAVS